MQTRQLFHHRKQRLCAVFAVSRRLGSGEELVSEAGGGKRCFRLFAGLKDKLQVFLLKVNREAGPEVAGDHARAQVGQLP